MARHQGAGRRPRHGVTGGMRANMAARDAHEKVLQKKREEAAARQSQMPPQPEPPTKPKPGGGPKGA